MLRKILSPEIKIPWVHLRYGRFDVIHPIHKCKNENHTTGFEVRNTFNDKEFAEFAKNAKFDFIKYFHFANNVDFEIQLKENPETDYEGLLLPSKIFNFVSFCHA